MTKQPVILQVLPALNSGGVERGTIEIAQAIHWYGYKPLVASSGGRMKDKVAYMGGEHITLPLDSKHPLTIYNNAARLQRVIREYKVDIIHARSRAPAWSAWMAAQRENIPFLTTFHGVYRGGSALKNKYNSVMVKGDRVIAVSNFIKQHILKHYDCPEDKVTVIHRGVDVATFHPELVSAARLDNLARQWNLHDHYGPVIFMPGRITRWKGHEVLIKALGRIKERDFLCIMAGDAIGHPDYYREMEKLIASLGLENRIRFASNTQAMAEAYTLSDMVIVPSTAPEAFGRVPIEAQAMGKVVIASDHGGVQETIIDRETGFLVPPSDDQALAQRILDVLDMDQAQRQEMGYAGMHHVYANFTAQQMQEKTMSIYQAMMAEKPRKK